MPVLIGGCFEKDLSTSNWKCSKDAQYLWGTKDLYRGPGITWVLVFRNRQEDELHARNAF